MSSQDDPGIHPSVIYAFVKCGFMVTEANAHLMSDDMLDEWDDAIAEGMTVLGVWDDDGQQQLDLDG